MNKKYITVSYWNLQKPTDLSYDHNQRFLWSERKFNAIVDKILSKGYNLMVKQCSDGETLAIWVDKSGGSFKQS